MSRRRRPPRGVPGTRPAGPGRPPARWRPLVAILLVALLLVVGGLVAWRLRGQRTPPATPAPLSTEAMAESVRVATDARDWERALRWAQRCVAADSSDAMSRALLGVAWHNLATAASPQRPARAATRTSLVRIGMEVSALAALEAASVRPASDELWVQAMVSSGQVYEVLGLPLEALQYNQAASRRLSDHPAVLAHVVYLEKSLHDPLTDPSGWYELAMDRRGDAAFIRR